MVTISMVTEIVSDAPGTASSIAEVSGTNQKDSDSSPNNCNLSNFVVEPASDDECDEVEWGVLPVELVSFEATLDGNNAVLTWLTASETNNAGFEIQARALDATDKNGAFTRVAYVEGHGTTDQAQRYSAQVADLAPGRHVFRLKQVDYDGTFEYSPEVEVSVEMPATFVVDPAYPNPFNPEASMSFGVRVSQQVTVEVFNLLGQKVLEVYRGTPATGVMQTVRIDGSLLQSGTYVVRVQGETFADTQMITLIK
jgi:hypothetical protein